MYVEGRQSSLLFRRIRHLLIRCRFVKMHTSSQALQLVHEHPSILNRSLLLLAVLLHQLHQGLRIAARLRMLNDNVPQHRLVSRAQVQHLHKLFNDIGVGS